EPALESLPKTWLDTGLVTIVDDSYDALETCDALILVTEWKQFRRPDFDKIKQTLTLPLIFDGRNQYEPEKMSELGITHIGIGRGNQ
ncbi:MAG: UDP-glucose 6-dehydrogenase, partial [Gammaproteobacteria bacterium]